ncbi:MAG: hypothetical protein NZ899_09360 [Thermoguttaceae bacterium]|nr:hypothetical protein [Thermoguttaceae bacterium]MDW8079340.1 hypothetical protein [Thermoguttaceae bacterium]
MRDIALKGLIGLVAIGLILSVVGCGGIGGERLVTIRGRVLEKGQPVRAGGPEEGGRRIELTFYPVDEAGNPAQGKQSWSCTVQADGSFVMDGAGKGIPAGRYKVVVRGQAASGQYDPRAPKAAGGDIFEGRFSLQKTPFVYNFTSNQEITIDIGTAEPGEQAAKPQEAAPQEGGQKPQQ